MTAQCSIEQQILRSRIVEYAADLGSMSEADAAAWLDANCPVWLSGIEPKANKIEADDDHANYH